MFQQEVTAMSVSIRRCGRFPSWHQFLCPTVRHPKMRRRLIRVSFIAIRLSFPCRPTFHGFSDSTLISHVILKQRWQKQIFWIIVVVSALAFALGHIPSVMIILGLKKVNEIPFALMSEMIILNGALSIFAAYYFRKFGFLAAVGIHFWADVIWHVIWGMI